MKEFLKSLLGDFDISKIIGHELTWALFLIGTLLLVVSHAYLDNANKQQNDCNTEKTELKIQVKGLLQELQYEQQGKDNLYEKMLNLQDTARDYRRMKDSVHNAARLKKSK